MRYRNDPPETPSDDDQVDDAWDDASSADDSYESESATERYARQRDRYREAAADSDYGAGYPLWMKVGIGIGAVFVVASLLISMGAPIFLGGNDDGGAALDDTEYEVADFVSVLDAETIVVDLDGDEEAVRLIGVDSVRDVAGFEEQVVALIAGLLTDRAVSLEAGETDRDQLDNLLRYVHLNDGSILNEALLRSGLATLGDVADGNDRYVARMRGAQELARAQSIGVWSLDR